MASGTLIKIRCEPPEAEGLIEGVAKVVWIRTQPAEGGPAGMGVKFVKLKGDSERVLQALVDGVVAAGGSVAPVAHGRAAEALVQEHGLAAAQPEPALATAAATAEAPKAEAASDGPRSTRPSAADLAARLRKSKAPAAAGGPARAVPEPELSAAEPATAARSTATTERTTEPVELPRASGPVTLVMAGLVAASVAIGAWLLLR
jgi:hypothetical protein